MEIINDTEVFEPQECFFALTDNSSDDSVPLVCITSIEYWNENHCLSDGIGDQSFKDGVIPSTIFPSMEAVWESELNVEDTRKAMLSAGFIESLEMTEAMIGLY